MFTEKYAGKMCRHIYRTLTFSRVMLRHIQVYTKFFRREKKKRKKRDRKIERLFTEGIRKKYDWGTAAVSYAKLLDKSCVYLTCLCMQIKTESQVRTSAMITFKIVHRIGIHRIAIYQRRSSKNYILSCSNRSDVIVRVHCPSLIHPGWQRVLRRRGCKVEQFPSVRTLHPIVRLQRRTARRNEAIELKGLGGLRGSVHQFATAGGY